MPQLDVAGSPLHNGHVKVADSGAEKPRKPSLLTRVIKEIAGQAQSRIPRANLDERDPDYIRERLPLMWLLSSIWFRAEVRGLGNIPD